MRWGGGKGREGKHEWEAVVLIPFIDEVGRREGEGGEARMGGCGVIPFIDEVGRREGEGGEAGMEGALWCDPFIDDHRHTYTHTNTPACLVQPS